MFTKKNDEKPVEKKVEPVAVKEVATKPAAKPAPKPKAAPKAVIDTTLPTFDNYYKQGQTAALGGISAEDCPHGDGDAKAEWLKGHKSI